MLVQDFWLLSLLFIASTTALLSTSSSHHPTIITKTTLVSNNSTHHSSTNTIKKSTVKTSSTHRPSSSSTKSSTGTPTSTPSIFYLVAADTGQTEFDGSYFKLIPDPDPTITLSGDDVLQFGNKNSDGAANFTLNADGTLQCNSGSGPLYACVSNGHPYTQSLEFEDPDDLDEWGLVAVTCAIADRVLTCQWGPLVVFYFEPSDVVDGKQIGEILEIGIVEDGTPFTIQVVPA